MKSKKPQIIVISILSLIIFSSLFVFLLTKNTTSSPQIISSQYNHETIPEVYQFCYKKFSEFGFKNVTAINPNKCIENRC